jgi:hypothetical protein
LDEGKSQFFGSKHQVTLDDPERLVRAFARSSAIGFAILDDQLRYQAVNMCLACINGMPAAAHLGVAVREIFGKRAQETGRAYLS